jgi:predicted dehydrogenase
MVPVLKLKVVVVGSGDMGRTHARAYARLDEVSLAAVVDLDESRSAALAKELGIPHTYVDYREAIEREQPEIVSVCVPVYLHPEVAITALELGANVLSEKPIALTVEAAEQMIAASRRAKGKLGVIFQRRFLRVWQEAQARLPLLGRPATYLCDDFRPIRPKVLMHSQGGNGGPLIDCCVHDLDMTRQLFGEARRVFASGDVYARGKEALRMIDDLAIDTAHLVVEYERGDKAAISYCWGLPTGVPGWGRSELLGPEGAIRVFGDSLEHQRAGGVEKVEGLQSNGHGEEIAAFVRAIATGGPVPVAPEDGLAALRIARAALESIRTGAPVTL